MNTHKRAGKKWTITETLSLEREFDLLNLSLQEMASRHKRTEEAILFKLESEGLIDCWDKVSGFNLDDYRNRMNGGDDLDDDYVDDEHDDYEEDGQDEDDDDSCCLEDVTDHDIGMLTERIWSLETSVSQISAMVKQMFDVMSEKKSSGKHRPLRR